MVVAAGAIDEHLLGKLVEDDENSIVKQRWSEKCLRNSFSDVLTVQAAVSKSKEIVKCAGDWLPSSLKAQVLEANAMLLRLESGETIVTKPSVTPWLTQVAKQMEYFIPCALPASVNETVLKQEVDESADDSASNGVAVGLLQELMQSYRRKNGPASLADLKVLSSFRHLLDPAEVKEVAAWRDALLKASATPVSVQQQTEGQEEHGD